MKPEWLDSIFAAGAAGATSKGTHPAALAILVRETTNGHIIHLYKSSESSAEPQRSAGAAADSPLTTRELEVLRLVAAGLTNADIAQKLRVTEQTVKFHLSNVYRKLNVGNRTEASRYGHLNGLLGHPQPSSAR